VAAVVGLNHYLVIVMEAMVESRLNQEEIQSLLWLMTGLIAKEHFQPYLLSVLLVVLYH
jgi:hypothetical protein